jgi:predicted nuclease of restriction endonuclease-like (RecB) superfamily
MIRLYWRIGQLIIERQRYEGWGAQVITRLSVDLRTTYPQVKGCSRTNLLYMRAFALAWPEIVQQPVGRLPWGHITVLLDQVKEPATRDFYARKVVEEGWSRNVLTNMIKGKLHQRVGTAPATFERTVPLEQQESIRQAVRDPYILDWISDAPQRERELEDQLASTVARFLQELGTGFAFVGRQHCLLVDGEEFFVIELKSGTFAPEHAGKLSFYVNVVDDQMRDPQHDLPTIGLLLVARRNDQVVELALRTISSPLAVSPYDIGELPADVREALPSEEDLAGLLNQSDV